MIGLKRHTVQIVDHDSAWPDLAAEACRLVSEVVGELIVDIQHVGSTAVPHLPAKPILDLAAAVTSLNVMQELVEKLTALGYIYRGDGADSGGHLFVWESEPDIRTIHLHVIAIDDPQWTNYLFFRDVLQMDQDLRCRYSALKEELKTKYSGDRRSYTNSKHDFIRGILSRKAQQTGDLNVR